MSDVPTIETPPLFGNAVNLLNAYVERATGVLAVTRIPTTRPSRFIRTLRVGGYRRDPVTDVARVVFECWNDTSTKAERDAQTVRDLLFRSRGVELLSGDHRYKVHGVDEVAGPSDDPDPDSGSPRYILTLEIHLRGRFHKETP